MNDFVGNGNVSRFSKLCLLNNIQIEAVLAKCI